MELGCPVALLQRNERFVDPTPERAEVGVCIIPEYHGRSGDIAISYPSQQLIGKFSSSLAATWKALGVSVCQDANSGRVKG